MIPMKIRFEMMFDVRCQKCNNSIGKGVRFNAKKKSIGKYLSTNIYEFTMNCHLCDNRFIIRTDPKGCDYDIVSGIDKRFDDNEQAQDIKAQQVKQEENKNKLESNAFFKLENVALDKEKADLERPRLERILELKQANKDDFNLNSILRKRQRENKKSLIEKEEQLKRPKNFGLQLINKISEEDLMRTKQAVIMQSNNRYAKSRVEHREQIKSESIFGGKSQSSQMQQQIKQLPVGIKKQIENKLILSKVNEQKQTTQKHLNIIKHLQRKNNQ